MEMAKTGRRQRRGEQEIDLCKNIAMEIHHFYFNFSALLQGRI